MQIHPLTARLALGAALIALAAAPAPARAHDDTHDEDHDRASSGDLALAVDIDYALPIDVEALGDDGGGFAIRAGWQLHVPLLVLTPEIGFAYHSFSGNGEPSLSRGFIGVRAGFGEIFRFVLFGHIGLCGLSADVVGPDPS